MKKIHFAYKNIIYIKHIFCRMHLIVSIHRLWQLRKKMTFIKIRALVIIIEELIVITIAELILRPFRHFTYVTTNFQTLSSLYLLHRLFSNTSVASPMSQFILQPFFRFSYVTSSSVNSPGEPPMRARNVEIELEITIRKWYNHLCLENICSELEQWITNKRIVIIFNKLEHTVGNSFPIRKLKKCRNITCDHNIIKWYN